MHTPERTCNELQSQLPLHVGGDLEAPLAMGLEQHLEACAACARELERLRASRALLLGLKAAPEPDTLEPQADLWPRLRPELVALGAFGPPFAPKGSAAPEPVRWSSYWPVGVLAAAGLVGLLVWLGWRDTTVGPSSPLVVEDTTPALPGGVPGSTPGGRRLERAGPDAEHLADTALPFGTLTGDRRAAHQLASENGLR